MVEGSLQNHCKMSVNNDNIQEYIFCRILFGIISSSFLLTATVEHHLDSYESELAKKIENKHYVDNLVSGTNSVSNAINLYHSAKSI